MTNIELSRTHRKYNQMSEIGLNSYKNHPTASTGEHGTKISTHSMNIIPINPRDVNLSSRSKLSNRNSSSKKNYEGKPHLKLSYNVSKSSISKKQGYEHNHNNDTSSLNKNNSQEIRYNKYSKISLGNNLPSQQQQDFARLRDSVYTNQKSYQRDSEAKNGMK